MRCLAEGYFTSPAHIFYRRSRDLRATAAPKSNEECFLPLLRVFSAIWTVIREPETVNNVSQPAHLEGYGSAAFQAMTPDLHVHRTDTFLLAGAAPLPTHAVTSSSGQQQSLSLSDCCWKTSNQFVNQRIINQEKHTQISSIVLNSLSDVRTFFHPYIQLTWRNISVH